MSVDDLSDSFLLTANQGPPCASNVLSQLEEGDPPVFAGQLETADGQVMPFTIGKTDIGNGKPRPFIHLSDHPSIVNRHVTITTVQTKDGKFRATLRQNQPQTRVTLGGSVIRANVAYPITDEDEISLGDGVRFRLRLNNQGRRALEPLNGASYRPSIGRSGLTQPYIPSPDSETSFESEQALKLERRKQFSEKLSPADDSLLLQLAAACDPPVSLVHQPVDTCPYSSQPSDTAMERVASQQTECQPTQGQQARDQFMISTSEAEDQGGNTQSPLVGIRGHGLTDGRRFTAGKCQERDHLMEELEEGSVGEESEEGEGAIFEEESAGGEELMDEQSDQYARPMEEPAQGEGSTEGLQEKEATEEQFEHGGSPVESPTLIDTASALRAPQLSQAESDVPLMERMERRRSKREQEKQEEVPAKRARDTRASGRLSVGPFSGGPKKLIILKTAVEVDKPTEAAVVSFGGKMETKWSEKVQALVTGGIVRTTKFLCAINKGLPIFPKCVLADIRTHKALPRIDDPSLWLSDPDGEAKYEFNLRESIERARTRPLLRNFEIFFYKNGIGEFSSEEFRDLISSAGGKMVARLPKGVPEDEEGSLEGGCIVIGAEGNKVAAKSAGLSYFHKIEFIVDCCMKQKLDFDYGRIHC